MQSNDRPLSPHLQVYRPQLTSMLSIFHRVLGVVLMVGTPLFIFWIVAAAYGPETYGLVEGFFGHWFGTLCLLGWSFALVYHMCNGVRHIIWDIGLLLPIRQVYASGYVMVAMVIIIWVAVWAVGLSLA